MQQKSSWLNYRSGTSKESFGSLNCRMGSIHDLPSRETLRNSFNGTCWWGIISPRRFRSVFVPAERKGGNDSAQFMFLQRTFSQGARNETRKAGALRLNYIVRKVLDTESHDASHVVQVIHASRCECKAEDPPNGDQKAAVAWEVRSPKASLLMTPLPFLRDSLGSC